MPQSQDNPNPYMGLRNMALQLQGTMVGASDSSEKPYAVVTDVAVSQGVATIVAALDGTASIYASSGGGYIGGAGNPAVKAAAQRAVAATDTAVASLHPVTDFPLPEPGFVSFYVLTMQGILGTTVLEKSLMDKQSLLRELYAAVQDVVTQYRLNSTRRGN